MNRMDGKMSKENIKEMIEKFESTEPLTDFEVLHLREHYQVLDDVVRNDPNLKGISFYSTTRLNKLNDMYESRQERNKKMELKK